jgi:hypothetical protein
VPRSRNKYGRNKSGNAYSSVVADGKERKEKFMVVVFSFQCSVFDRMAVFSSFLS